jgi:hypothetical protein
MSMKNLLVLMFTLCFPRLSFGQSNELSFSVGGIFATGQRVTTILPIVCPVPLPNCNINTNRLTNSPGAAFVGDFAHRITNFGPVSLYLEAPVVGGPKRDTTLSSTSAPFFGNIATFSSSALFFTPAAKVKFLDSSTASPFVSIGGGLARLGLGSGNKTNTGALQFGGGVDFKSTIPHLVFRAEVRDFFSGTALHSTSFFQVSPSHQHVVFAGGGAVFRF